jgi:HK97 gp10 family phage protein
VAIGEYGGVEVQGLKELGEALRAFPPNVARNVGRASTAAAGAEIRNEAQQLAPVYTGDVAKGHPPPGTLKRSIVLKFIREKSSALLFVYFVHVRRGKKYQQQGKFGNLSQDAYYWTFVEYGTSKMAARPFMRPAFEAAKERAVAMFQEYLSARIPAEAERLKLGWIRGLINRT